MAIDWKSKKLWVGVGGVALTALCIVAMTKCSSNGDERDAYQGALANQTARVDSLEAKNQELTEAANKWYRAAKDHENKANALTQANNELIDSVDVLNDSVARMDSLLNVCRNSRRAAAVRKKNKYSAAVKSSSAKGQAAVKGAPSSVTINGGSNNTVNVNNGVINNYYNAPENKKKCQAADSARVVSSSAAVKRTVTVTVVRGRCK